MATSGSRSFNPTLGEIVISAYSRIGTRRTELTQQHMADAEFEANLLQTDMQGDGINLYQVVLQTQDIIPGQTAYYIDPTTVFMLDVYIRQNNYGSYPLGVGWANNTPYVDNWINNNNTVTTWTSDQLPMTTNPNSGITDRLLLPISRSDYAATANKGMMGQPTTFWYDRLIDPKMYLWPVPNQFIPQGLQYYIQQRPQNADLINGTQLEIPYEAMDYFVWSLSERLAYIYSPNSVAMIGPRKAQAYQKWLQASTENTQLNIETEMKSYFRVG